MGVRERYEQRQKEGKSSDYSGVKQRYMAKEIENVGSSITNRVNTWLKNHNTYISNYQTRNSGRKYNYEDSYVSDSADWLNTVSQQKSAFDAEADSILSYMDQYKDYLNADWMAQVRKTLTDARGAQDIVLGNTRKDNEWWSGFGSDEMLKAHGSAEEAYKYYQWDDGLKKKYTGATGDDIQKALDSLGVGEERDWLRINQGKIFGDSIRENTDFQDYVTTGSSLSYDDFGTETMRRGTSRRMRSTTTIDKYRAASLALAEHYGNEAPLGIYDKYDEEVAIFRTMKDEEFENLAYCIAYDKQNGTKTAEQYVNFMEETLSARRGTDIGEKITGIDIPIIEDLAVLGYGALAGVDNFAFGIEQFMSDDEVAYYPSYYANAHIADSLDGLGYYAHSAATNIGNMAPSILVSGVVSGLGVPRKVSEAIGSTTMGVSAAGSAYKEALAKGYDKESARTYSNLVGASEGLLQYLIGGVSKLGGVSNIFSKLAGKISLIDDALLRGAAKYGMSIGSEVFEEEIQNFLEPAFRSIIFGEDYDAPTINEMIETAIVTALSTSVLEGGSTYTGIKEDMALDKQAAKDYGDKTDALIQEGLQNDVKSVSYKLAQKYQQQTQGKDGKNGKAMTGAQIRNLLAANQAEVTKADLGKIQDAAANRLAQVGQREDIYKIAELATKYATGQEMTRAERSTLARSSYGSQVASEMLNGIHPDKLLSKWENNMSEEPGAEYSTDWTGEIDTESDQFIRFNNKKLARAILDHLANSVVEDPASYKSLKSRVEAEEPAQVSDTGKSVIRGTDQEIDLTKPTFKEITDGVGVLEADGKLVSANNIDYADENLGYAIRSVGKIENITPEAAGAVVSLVDMSKPVVAQMNGIDEAYTYGYNNYSVEDMKAGNLVSNLTEQQMMSAYKLGQSARAISDEKSDAPIVQMRTAAEAKLTAEQKTAQQEARFKGDAEVYFMDGSNVVKFDESGVQLDESNERDQRILAGVNTAKFLSKLGIGGKYYFYQSYLKGNTRYYKDANGVEKPAPNGFYTAEDGSIYIDLNAGNKGQGTTLYTLGHELTHFVKDKSKKQFKILGELVTEAFDKTDMSMHDRVVEMQNQLSALRDKRIDYTEAYEEVVADAMSTMLSDGSFYDKIMEIKGKDKGLFNSIKEFFENLIAKFKEIYAGLTPDQRDAQDIQQMKDMFDRIQTAFAEALVEASDNFQAAMESVVEAKAEPISSDEIITDGAVVTNGDGEKHSIRSMKHDIADGKMFEDLKTYCSWTDAQVNQLKKDLNALVEYMIPYRNILDMNESYGREGRRFSPYKPNSDPLYKISMDFSTLCSKRLLTQYVIENLQLRENRPMSPEEQMAIRDMLNEYRKVEKGLQVACAMCYVEAARLKSPKQIQRWLDDPTPHLINYFAQKNTEFNASVKAAQADFKESKGYDRNAPKKDMKPADVKELNKIGPKLRAQYQLSEAEQAIVDRAKTLPNSTYLTAGNLANLSETDPAIYAAYTSFVRTATRSKSLETDEPYYYGDSTRDNGNGIIVSDSFIEAVNRENGMRFSSWSDWRIQHMLDYITAVIDNSVRGAAMHGYTKFGDEVRVLGKTGMMFNMSGVAGTQNGLNEDGSLNFSETESIDVNEAIQLRDEFPDTAGLQCIGVSNEHIIALLRSDIIDYVIPYHVSGLNAALRRMADIQGWKDYTSTQHAAIDKSIKYEVAVDKEHWHEEPVFSEFFVGYDTGMTGIEAMRASAEKYKQLCKDRGLTPKFEQFANEENYWKLLIDRKMINQETGKLIQQRAVTPTFDFGAIKQVVDRYVQNYDAGLEKRALNHIVENWDTIPQRIKELKKGSKTKKAVNTLANQTVAAQPKATAKNSDRLYMDAVKSGDMETAQQMVDEAAKKAGYTVKVYHGTNQMGFTVFDPKKSDDKISLFFTDSQTVAKTYASHHAKVKPTSSFPEIKSFKYERGKKYTEEEMREAFDVIQSVSYIYGIPKFNVENQTMYHAGTRYSAKQLMDLADHYSRMGLYEVFVNPDGMMEIDAQKHNWNNIADPDVSEYRYKINYKGDNFNYFKANADDAFTLSLLKDGEVEYDGDITFHEMHSMLRKRLGAMRTEMAIRHATDGSGMGSQYHDHAYSDANGNYAKKFLTTRELAKRAKNQGYKGLIIKNVYDNGGKATGSGYAKYDVPSNLYIMFDSNQVKSADPVTYDKDGNVIPLSERFNPENKDIRYSERDSAGNKLTKEQKDYFANSKVRDRNGNLLMVYHGGTVENQFDTSRGGKGATQYGPGAYFTDSEYYAKEYTYYRGGDVKPYYLNIDKLFDDTDMGVTAQMPEWKKLEQILRDNGIEEKFIKRFADGGFAYMSRYLALKSGAKTSGSWEGAEKLNTMLREAGFQGIKGDFNDMHQYVVFDPEQAKFTSNKQPTSNPDLRYSERTNAPVFYSQMGKVVEGMKQEKFGASSVISMLRGRGVKAEEIRWSGIQAFLDGKKSVTKKELLDFIKGSMLHIEEQVRDNTKRYSPEQHERLLELETEIDYAWDEIFELWEKEFGEDFPMDLVVATFVERRVKKIIGTASKEAGVEISEDSKRIIQLASLIDRNKEEQESISYEAESQEPKWGQFKLDGGENYRELVFKMPDSTYSNTAMKGHWGEDAEGIIAHARMQDFIDEYNGVKMLFIEEIQSDWHNEGHTKGYVDESKRLTVANTEMRHEGQWYKLYHDGKDLHQGVTETFLKQRFRNGITEEQIHQGLVEEYNHVAVERKNGEDLVPDAPFKSNYHEYVLKRLIRMAAEEGYDSIGWTTADIQSDRWSDEYAEGYRIEYDQDIPKFLKKYGKQWGAEVGKTKITTGELSDWETDMIEQGLIEVQLPTNVVWSMDITPAMKKSVLSEGQVLYSERNIGDASNRHLLANAFEGISKSSIEYKMIQEYKGHIEELNKLDEKLSDLNEEIHKIRFDKETPRDSKKLKELQDEAKEVAKEINKHDKRLLNMEASEPLRKVIERERKKEAQKTKDHVKEIQENKKVRAEQTELRHKIRKAIRDLDKILKHGNKQKNVKEDLLPVVTKALQSADILFTDNYGTHDMLRNGIGADLSDAEEALVATCTRMLQDLVKMPTDGYDNFQARQEAERKLSYKMSNLKDVFARERKRLNSIKVSSILGELADAYASLEKSEQSYVQGAYTEAVHNFLKSLQSEVGGTIVKDMTKDQLEYVYAAYKMVLTTVRKANQMFNKELKMSREQLGNAVIQEVMNAGGVHGLWTKAELAASKADWNNMKPIWVANRIGSDTFGMLMKGLFEGQYNFAVDVEEAKQFKLSMDEKYKPRSWDAEKLYEFESSTGKKFSLNLQQIMSLYAFSKREQAYSHLLNGGFVFEGNSTVIVDEKGRKKTYIHNGATSYKLNEATLNDIISSLTKEQKAYVDEMQKYLSEVMGAKGNEVSMALYGIKMFKEQFYFPLRSSGAYMERAKEAEMKKQQGQINLVNSGFTHAVKPEAKNPIILAGFMDVWAEHCNEMSMYHSMVLPMEDFRKVYNYSTVHSDEFDSASVFQTIQDAYGDAATAYIDQLYRELNAGATIDPRETPFKKLISNFKKTAVMLSASVVVQQFSSIGRAYALIDPKYFIGTRVNSDTQLSVADEMKKYAPVAIIKEMGGFDTGTKGSAKSYIMAEKYGKGEWLQGLKKDEQYRSDLMGILPAKADEKTWCAIWEAVKRETKAKHPKMDVKSEEFLKLAGERFSEVIEKTQVYDSVLARSANMRSKTGLMQMATSFMAEPTTTVNLLEDAIRRGDKKYMARAFGAVAVSIVLNNALASIVYAMRDDDEDETFIEKYFQSFTSGMIDDINPMSYYPFLKDVYSLFQGYDVERADMSVIADLRDALKKAVGLIGKDTSSMDDDALAEHNKAVNSALLSLLDAGCSVFGVPFKNVRRDANGIINAWNTVGKDLTERDTSWNSFWDKVGAAAKDTIPIFAWTKDAPKTDKLYEAIVSGDKAYLARLKSTYKTDSAYQSAVRKALRENDSRIHEAAQAKYEGKTEEYKRIFRQIQNEGKFSFDDIMSAINSELSAIRNKLEPDKATSSYTASDFVESIVLGDTKSAEAMKEDIIATKVANGKTPADAEKEFTSAVATGIHDAYSSGLLDDAGAENMLMEYAGKDEEEAASKVNYWAFCEEHPQYELTESNVADYQEFAEPAEISLDVFVQYINGTKGISTKYDQWGDVELTVREQVLEVIDSLPLTWQQKDALYLAAGYSESKIWDVPW